MFAVGDRVERMARAERLELVVLSHDLLDLLDGGGVEDVPRAVADVAGPVGERSIQGARRSMFDLAGSGGRKIGLQQNATKLLRSAVRRNHGPKAKAETQNDTTQSLKNAN